MSACHACPQARGHVCTSGGAGGRRRPQWLGGVPFGTRHRSTSGLRSQPTAPPGSPSVARCSRRLPRRKGCFSCPPPRHSCGSTSPVLSGHIPPKNRRRPCERKPGIFPLPFGRPCAATGCVRACNVSPWLPNLSIFGAPHGGPTASSHLPSINLIQLAMQGKCGEVRVGVGVELQKRAH